MRAVGLEFLESARRTWTVECDLRAPRGDVWTAYSDPTTWSAWFPGVRSARYRGSDPYGVGTIREAEVGGQRFEEVMVAWEEGVRWAYFIDRATVPLARAQLECTDFEDCNGGTRLRWTIASDPRLILWAGAPVFPRVMRRLFEKATRNLDAAIEAQTASGPPREESA
jgi:carbon monoxide dehydrogenase subunit G